MAHVADWFRPLRCESDKWLSRDTRKHKEGYIDILKLSLTSNTTMNTFYHCMQACNYERKTINKLQLFFFHSWVEQAGLFPLQVMLQWNLSHWSHQTENLTKSARSNGQKKNALGNKKDRSVCHKCLFYFLKPSMILVFILSDKKCLKKWNWKKCLPCLSILVLEVGLSTWTPEKHSLLVGNWRAEVDDHSSACFSQPLMKTVHIWHLRCSSKIHCHWFDKHMKP